MGLIVNVYHTAGGDCTRGGVSAQHAMLTVANVDGPFDPSRGTPPVLLEMHVPGCLRIVPAVMHDGEWVRAPGWWMMGGNFAHTSDSRLGDAARQLLGHVFYGAIAIHDRQE